MATCKDCLHSEVCAYIKPDLPICADFADCSKYVVREKGEWGNLYYNEDYEDFMRDCSICDKPHKYLSDFCPNCGADMREEENG